MARIEKRGKPKVAGCMHFDMPPELRGRSTSKQRTQYYGWHLVAQSNMRLNNLPKIQQEFFKKLFFGKIKPTKMQAKVFLKIVSLNHNKPLVIAMARLNRIIGDIGIIRTQFKQGGYTPQTIEAFEEGVKVFEGNIKALKSVLLDKTLSV